MQIQPQSIALISPYKTLGVFVEGPTAISQSPPYNIAVSCDKSFKIYSQELSIKVVSPCFPNKIKAIATHNQYTYAYADHTLYKMQYCHMRQRWNIEQDKKQKKSQNCNILLFDKTILLQQANHIYVIADDNFSLQVRCLQYQFNIEQMVHPVTYVNKLLIADSQNLLLVNPITEKVIYRFKNIANTVILQQKQTKIQWVKETPLVDIIAIGLRDTNEIMIVNIKKDTVVFVMKQKQEVSAVAFSKNQPYMATGDITGNIILWDLQNKRIIYRFQNAFKGHSISSLIFHHSVPILTAMSSQENSIRQFRINKDDNKTLTLYRQRCGSKNPICHLSVPNNKQLCFYTQNQMVFSSLYTHTNNYILPNNQSIKKQHFSVLGDSLPFHIITHNYKIILYKERTPYCEGIIPHKQYGTTAKMSISNHLIIATRSKVIKMRINKLLHQNKQKNKEKKNIGKLETVQQWDITNVQAIHLFNESSVFMARKDGIYVYDFNSNNYIFTINPDTHCTNIVTNSIKNLLAFEVRKQQQSALRFQIWDMKGLKRGRTFVHQPKQENICSNCLAFTPDNRFLLTALSSSEILIWSIIDNMLYSIIKIENNIKTMAFTPDSGYLLTVYKQEKQVYIWNNYIGKIPINHTSNSQILKFQPPIKSLPNDYRQRLASVNNIKKEQPSNQNLSISEQFAAMVAELEPEEESQQIEHYDFQQISKWMPLVYYDEIRERNSIEIGDKETTETKSGIPFFLDFSNITEEKEKLQKQIREELSHRKKQQSQKRDILLKNDSHAIYFTEDKMEAQYLKTYEMLITLSIAEIDYQFRKYLIGSLDAQNFINISQMFIYIYENYIRQGYRYGKIGNATVYNILLIRYLNLLGTDICREELKSKNKELLAINEERYNRLENIVWRDVAILQNKQ